MALAVLRDALDLVSRTIKQHPRTDVVDQGNQVTKAIKQAQSVVLVAENMLPHVELFFLDHRTQESNVPAMKLPLLLSRSSSTPSSSELNEFPASALSPAVFKQRSRSSAPSSSTTPQAIFKDRSRSPAPSSLRPSITAASGTGTPQSLLSDRSRSRVPLSSTTPQQSRTSSPAAWPKLEAPSSRPSSPLLGQQVRVSCLDSGFLLVVCVSFGVFNCACDSRRWIR